MNLQRIQLVQLTPDIFDDIAQEAADYISQSNNSNKSTQIRKFYDELVMWHEKVFGAELNQREQIYQECAPFIHMLKAKVAYAKGRQHVDESFEKMFGQCIGQINSPATLKHAKLFFEAVLGFRKALERSA